MNTVERLSGKFVSAIHNLAALLLAAAAALVFYQVVTRFVLGDSATWTEVLARAVIIWMVFLVTGPALRLGRMIPIDVIRGAMPRPIQIWLVRFVSLAIATVLLVLIWYGYKMTMRVVDQQVAMISISVAWFYVAVPVGSALALIGLFLSHLDAERGHTRQLDENIDEETME
ncbi:TRAP transporter small permease [uncultured Roseovarius sp.]|uniref:TRAP transporter small permease n=1 Tax=uncultured Roseovarius sp. TaxID=293344 RepID=UPI0026087EB5|nr:TRAP transporter small permease [uncultured Roseovarius sp.]